MSSPHVRTSFKEMIRGDDVMVVADATADPHFRGNPLIEEEGIRFNAGAGRGVELVGPNDTLLVARTVFVSLRVRHILTTRLGLTAALRYSDDGPFARTGGSIGLFARW